MTWYLKFTRSCISTSKPGHQHDFDHIPVPLAVPVRQHRILALRYRHMKFSSIHCLGIHSITFFFHKWFTILSQIKSEELVFSGLVNHYQKYYRPDPEDSFHYRLLIPSFLLFSWPIDAPATTNAKSRKRKQLIGSQNISRAWSETKWSFLYIQKKDIAETTKYRRH